MTSYKDYQIILLLKKLGTPNVKPIRLSQRSSLGCFTCKRKKVKCDETKWTCKRCQSSRLECHWPEKVLKLYEDTNSQVAAESPVKLEENMSEEISEVVSDVINDVNISELPLVWQSKIDQCQIDCKGDDKITLMTQEESPLNVTNGLLNDLAYLDTLTVFPNLYNQGTTFQEMMDSEFLRQFSEKFLPAIPQTQYFDSSSRQKLILSGAGSSSLLRNIFVACGALSVAYEDNSYKQVAMERCTAAITAYLNEVRRVGLDDNEDWLLVAVQVLQTLCYRDMFTKSHATRAATHFAAAYLFLSLRLFGSGHELSVKNMKVLQLDLMMIENFIFNYSVIIMFCDHTSLPQLVINPYALFSQANRRLKELYLTYDYPQLSQMSILAFLIAAKCSWLCRLCLPLSIQDQLLVTELLSVADVALQAMNLLSANADLFLAKKTISIARVVLHASQILLEKMLDSQYPAEKIQTHIDSIHQDISQPYNKGTIFPVWAYMIAGCASTQLEDRDFFRTKAKHLMAISRSQIVQLVVTHLEKMWSQYSGLEPLDLLLDTQVLDRVCK